jgi:membrane associated rhomboid family serine protease
VSETERDSGWSEQYAETGGWPPPAEGQRRYGPGTTPPPPAPGTGQPASGWGQATDDPHAGRWTQPPHGADPAETGGYPGRSSQRAAADTGGQPGRAGQPGGSGQPAQWGQAAGYGQAGQSGQAGGYGQAGQPGQAGGQPGQWEQAGSAGQWAQGEQGGAAPSAWAPGDSAYGRLERGGGPARPQRPRRPWDGRPAAARRPTGTRTPVVTYTLIGICVVIYLIQQANPSFTTRYGLIPYAVEQGQYARLITSAFLHASVLHLATNMITLFIVGTPLERVLRPARYLVVYLLSALGGSLLSVWLSPQFSIGVGASGAIFGLFGALVVLRRQVGAEAGGLVVLIGLNLVISFAVPNISWQAHIGGLVTGVLVALALMGVDRLSRRPAT